MSLAFIDASHALHTTGSACCMSAHLSFSKAPIEGKHMQALPPGASLIVQGFCTSADGDTFGIFTPPQALRFGMP
eukprot:1157595-Pelagomonas_calceolata.AAC.3